MNSGLSEKRERTGRTVVEAALDIDEAETRFSVSMFPDKKIKIIF